GALRLPDQPVTAPAAAARRPGSGGGRRPCAAGSALDRRDRLGLLAGRWALRATLRVAGLSGEPRRPAAGDLAVVAAARLFACYTLRERALRLAPLLHWYG